MNIYLAEYEDLETVFKISQTTISKVYPNYYPTGAVEFFLSHHNKENILNDISERNVYILKSDNIIVGTVTINNNEINRLFVLPEYQHRGFGKALLDFAENEILKRFNSVRLSASFPAKKIYLKRGYKDWEFDMIRTENGDFLCYDTMIME